MEGFSNHQVPVFPPDAVVSFVLEYLHLSDVLPTIFQIGSLLDQSLLQFGSPVVFAYRGVDNVAETLSDLQFALHNDLLRNVGPSLGPVVLAQDNQHQALAIIPSTPVQVRIDSVVKLVVNFLKGSAIDELAYFLPIVTITLLLLYDHRLLIDIKGSFALFPPDLLEP